MKIRYRVNQAESFRRGIDAPEPIASLEINPSLLPENQRELIYKHLLGTDVVYDPKRAMQEYEAVPIGEHQPAELVEAKDSRFDSLLVALAELEPQTNQTVQTVHFRAEPTVAQKLTSN